VVGEPGVALARAGRTIFETSPSLQPARQGNAVVPPLEVMMEDDGFLRAIIDPPNDEGLRLVYADWLEEE
jgi:hypothetical protein